jgi:hypothetical protein
LDHNVDCSLTKDRTRLRFGWRWRRMAENIGGTAFSKPNGVTIELVPDSVALRRGECFGRN